MAYKHRAGKKNTLEVYGESNWGRTTNIRGIGVRLNSSPKVNM